MSGTYLPPAVAESIKAEAIRLGFDACGIARAEAVPDDIYAGVEAWISAGHHGSMSYMERNTELRRDPRLLVEGCRSLIVVALGYYPSARQETQLPQIAKYAYGRDYHKVVKKMLDQLLDFIVREVEPTATGRAFADSAPILERYWAERAGLGWRGKHGLLIIPRMGSYYLLGCLLTNLELPPDSPLPNRCGTCQRCLEACPTKALLGDGRMDARRCISYLTIESSEAIPSELAPLLGGRLYGCDTCQDVCPWNRWARPTRVRDFAPRWEILRLRPRDIETMEQEQFDRLFAGSAIRRAGLLGLQRTLRAIAPHFAPTLGEDLAPQ